MRSRATALPAQAEVQRAVVLVIDCGCDGRRTAHGGAPYAYSATNHAGVTGAYIGVTNNGVLTQEGPVYTTDTSSPGAITTVTAAQQQAPSTGIPAPWPTLC